LLKKSLNLLKNRFFYFYFYMNKKRIVAIIPARGGSKGIPKKNIIDLAGKPLIAHNILAAKSSHNIVDVYVSTDDKEIAATAVKYDAKVIERPFEFATDKSKSEEALLHFAEKVNFDILVFLQCTAPLTSAEDIDMAIKTYLDGNYDSVLSVTIDHGGFLCGSFLWDKDGNSINYDYNNRPMRQDFNMAYRENGAIYVTSKENLLKYKNRLSGRVGLYIMPSLRSYEIDDMDDLNFLREIFYVVKKRGSVNYLKEKIKPIKMVIFDVDGVFTDGSVYLDKAGRENLKFSRIDGKGIEILKKQNIKTAIITAENSEIVKLRMEKLKIDDIFIGERDKIKIFGFLKDKYSFEDKNICFAGDDLQDLEPIKTAGLSVCPANAQQDIKNNCDYISALTGGQNFVREICNIIIEVKTNY